VLASISYTLGASLEHLTLTGTANLNGTGNAQGNLLVGNGGNNVLDGKAGADLLVGGQGNDTYVVDNLFDLVAEDPNAGTDKVKSAVSYTLGDNVENLELTGTAALSGTGNSLDNQILGTSAGNVLSGLGGNDNLSGGAGNDSLDGGEGNDWLIGGSGLDTLTGGAGNDVFRFDTAPAAANADHLTDFVSGTDDIQLSQALFKNAGAPGVLLDTEFATGTSFAATDVHHILYNTATGGLYYNADGAGTGAPVLIATLDGQPTLLASDIVLV
jgi:Ca2+-binding RTX toxin-like protein